MGRGSCPLSSAFSGVFRCWSRLALEILGDWCCQGWSSSVGGVCCRRRQWRRTTSPVGAADGGGASTVPFSFPFLSLQVVFSLIVGGSRFSVEVLSGHWQWQKFAGSVFLVYGSCLPWSSFQASSLRCTMARRVGELRSVCRRKGGTRVFPKDVLPWHRPLPFRAPGVIVFWLVGVSGNGPLPRFVWSAPLRAVHCNGGCLVLFCYCLVLISCILVISEVPYVAEPAVAFCIKAKNTHDNGVSAYCKTRVVPFVTLQVRSGCNSV